MKIIGKAMLNVYSVAVNDLSAVEVELDKKDIYYTLWECVDDYDKQIVIQADENDVEQIVKLFDDVELSKDFNEIRLYEI